MELSITGKDNEFVPWLIVEYSKMGTDAGFGVFADCQFHKHDSITIYFGERADQNDKDHT